jgi:hypothetical protein
MKKLLLFVFFTSVLYVNIYCNQIGFIGGYNVDLINQYQEDTALYLNINGSYILEVLVKDGHEYKIYKLYESDKPLNFNCYWSKEIKGRTDGEAETKAMTYKINEYYLVLEKPEAYSIAFFWDTSINDFRLIWLSV